MKWSDEQIGAELRAHDPAADLTDDRIDIARARARIATASRAAGGSAVRGSRSKVATAPAHRSSLRRRAVLVSGLAAAVVVAIAVVVPLMGVHAPSAAADGPPPLPFQSLDATVADVVDDAIATQQRNPSGVPAPLREARSNGWFADIHMNAGADGLKTIRPENRHLVWSDDLSGELTVTAGTAYGPDGSPVLDSVPAPGTVTQQQRFEAGQFVVRDAAPPGTDLAGLTALLNTLSNGETTSGAADHLTGVTTLLDMWTVPDEVHAAMLQVLESDGDLTVEGTTTDRAGRPAIGLRATSQAAPWFDSIVLVSTETGRIIGVEGVYTGLADQLPIPTGTVTNYTLWEAEP